MLAQDIPLFSAVEAKPYTRNVKASNVCYIGAYCVVGSVLLAHWPVFLGEF